jgi:hypothetical protein
MLLKVCRLDMGSNLASILRRGAPLAPAFFWRAGITCLHLVAVDNLCLAAVDTLCLATVDTFQLAAVTCV